MNLLQALQAMDWGEALVYLLNAVMVAMGGFILRYVVPWLKHLTQDTWIERAVKAAEQLYPEPGCGAQKKLYVTSSLLDAGVIRAGRNGMIRDSDNMRIEAQVLEVNGTRPGA